MSLKPIPTIPGLDKEPERAIRQAINDLVDQINLLSGGERVTPLKTAPYNAHEGEIVRMVAGLTLNLPRARPENNGKEIGLLLEGDGQVRVTATSSQLNGAPASLITRRGLTIFKSNGDGQWLSTDGVSTAQLEDETETAAKLEALLQAGFHLATAHTLLPNAREVVTSPTINVNNTATGSVQYDWRGLRLTGGGSSASVTSLDLTNSNGFSWLVSTNGSAATLRASFDALRAISAGTTLATNGTVIFTNGSNVSFGVNGNTVSASVATSLTNIRVSAGTTSNLLSAVTFSNGSNVSFGLNGSVITGSVATSLTAVNFSAGTTSNNLSAVTFSNGNNVSFGLAGSVLTGSVATSLTNFRLSAGTSSANLSAVTFANSNLVSFGLSGSVVTGSIAPGFSVVSAGTVATTGQSFILSNSNNVSFGASVIAPGIVNITATASVASSLTNLRVSAGTTSNLLSAITFSNGSGVSFGLNGSTLTAAIPAVNAGQVLGLQFDGVGPAVPVPLTGAEQAENFRRDTVQTLLGVSGDLNVTLNADTTVLLVRTTGDTRIHSLSGFAGTGREIVIEHDRSSGSGTLTLIHNSGSATLIALYLPDTQNYTLGQTACVTVRDRAGFWRLNLPTQNVQLVSHVGGNSVVAVSRLALSDGNGLSWSLSTATAGATLMGSVASSLTNFRVSAGTTSNLLSAITFSNSNLVSFGLNGSVLTGSIPSLTVTTGRVLGLQIDAAGSGVAIPLTGPEVGELTRYSFVETLILAPGGGSGAGGAYTSADIALDARTNVVLVSPTIAGDVVILSFSHGASNEGADVVWIKEGFIGRVIFRDDNVGPNSVWTMGGDINLTSYNDAVRIRYVILRWRPIRINAPTIFAGAASAKLGSLSFANGSGVSFGLSTNTLGGTITGSVLPGPVLYYEGSGPILTASLIDFRALGNLTASVIDFGGGVARVLYSAAAGSSGVALADVYGVTRTSGTVLFGMNPNTTISNLFSQDSRSNNVAFGFSGQTLTAQAHIQVSDGTGGNGNVATRLNFISGGNVTFDMFTGLNSAGARQVNVSANAPPMLVSHVGGNSIGSVSRIVFSNANNVTWALSTAANAVTVVAAAPSGVTSLPDGIALTSGDRLDLVLSGGTGVYTFTVDYIDRDNTTGILTYGSVSTNSIGSSVTILAAPSAGTTRYIQRAQLLTTTADGTEAVRIGVFTATDDRQQIANVVLLLSQRIQYTPAYGWRVFDDIGQEIPAVVL